MEFAKFLQYCCATFFLISSFAVKASDVIVNPSIELDSLSKSQLRRIYMLKQSQWPDKTTIQVFVMSNQSQLHKDFCQERLSLFPYQLQRIWEKAAFTGMAMPPIKVASEQELISRVQATPGAIGYIGQFDPLDKLKLIASHG